MAKANEKTERIEVPAALQAVEEALDKLRAGYERYFLGLDKKAPVKERERVQRQLRALGKLHLRSAVLRFRLAGLRARMVTFQHYWTRVERDMERGVSRRDRRRGGRSPIAADGPMPPAGDRGFDEENAKEVYRALVEAKRAVGESLHGFTYAALLRKLLREVPRLRDRHGCERVRFDVDTAGGKVRLKGRPA